MSPDHGRFCFVLQIESHPTAAQLGIEQQWPSLFESIVAKLGLVTADMEVRTTTTSAWLRATLPSTTPCTYTAGPAPHSEHAAHFCARFASTDLVDTPSGTRLRGMTPSQSTETLLPEVLNLLLNKTQLPYVMRASGWIRPVRAAACTWNDVPLIAHLERINLTTGTHIRRHPLGPSVDVRTLAPPAPHILPNLDIKPQYTALLEENVRTVHHPDHIVCTVPTKFQYLPPEFLDIALVQHQKLLPTNKLHAYVAIVEAGVCKETVATNLGRVVRARLQDLEFFYQQDKKQNPAEHSAGLDKRPVFQDLGSYLDKRTRVSQAITRFANNSQATLASAYLYFDLLTAIVEEFPELEGIAAEVYAKDPTIGEALRASMWPRNETDPQPTSITHAALWISWIKRLDTLVGFALLDKLPSGSRDPLALRRTGNGFVRVGMILQPNIDWTVVAEFLANAYPARAHRAPAVTLLKPFVHQRMMYCLRNTPPTHAEALLGAETNQWTALERAGLHADVTKIEQTYKRLSRLIADYPSQPPTPCPELANRSLEELCDWSNTILDTVHIQSSPDALAHLAKFTYILTALGRHARW